MRNSLAYSARASVTKKTFCCQEVFSVSGLYQLGVSLTNYLILASIVHIFYIENDAEIFPVHYTWKVAEKGFQMAFMMNKLAMINSCEIILEK